MKILVEMSEREYFANVAKRPGMFIGRSSFDGLTAYLEGYDQHARRHGGPGLDGWRDWLVARRGRGCSRVIKVLFELLDEFLSERELAIGLRNPTER